MRQKLIQIWSIVALLALSAPATASAWESELGPRVGTIASNGHGSGYYDEFDERKWALGFVIAFDARWVTRSDTLEFELGTGIGISHRVIKGHYFGEDARDEEDVEIDLDSFHVPASIGLFWPVSNDWMIGGVLGLLTEIPLDIICPPLSITRCPALHGNTQLFSPYLGLRVKTQFPGAIASFDLFYEFGSNPYSSDQGHDHHYHAVVFATALLW